MSDERISVVSSGVDGVVVEIKVFFEGRMSPQAVEHQMDEASRHILQLAHRSAQLQTCSYAELFDELQRRTKNFS